MSGTGVTVMVAGLAVLGTLWTFSAGAKAGRAVERQFREATRVGAVLATTSITAAVIVGIQWLVMTHGPGTGTALVVLGVPGLLAGVTVARLAAVTTVERRRGVRR
ncbi:MAG TPA: hypothetical protein VH008_01975 [Pseudonocardia sp.]|jgi:hypothetical protein|nr:hypothetical protein [Pseudonocardia sp.]